VCSLHDQAFVLTMDGPFEQKTGGKGANTAAAAGQTFPCEFIGNLGASSAESNASLLADLSQYGGVQTARCKLLDGATGTAYILTFEGGCNNQQKRFCIANRPFTISSADTPSL